MIISRTPLRISLVGGGTDMPAFYRKHDGAVVSFAIDKYVHVILNEKFDGNTRVSYAETENVASVAELKHDLIRETLRIFSAEGLETVTVADIPGGGTGLGSSSALTVGMLRALGRLYPNRISTSAAVLANDAYTIEARICKHPVGKQDHYAAAYGGVHCFEFHPSDSVTVKPIILSDEQLERMESWMLLLWTGIARSADEILRLQKANLDENPDSIEAACEMAEIAQALYQDLSTGYFGSVGKYLHCNWTLKKRLSLVSDPALNTLYEKVLRLGADGGKLCGAGGGGFFLFWAKPELHGRIAAETGLRRVPFKIKEHGSEIIYDSAEEN